MQQLERCGDADWVSSDLVRMEMPGAPSTGVMDRAAELRASTRQQTADAILLAAAMHGGPPALGAPPG
jgi:hypothetical protein